MTDVTLAEVLATAEQDGTAPRYQVPENWAQGRTAFGGFTGALLVNAARRDRPDLPALRSALINFTAPVSQPPTIHAEVLREGRNITTVATRAEIDGKVAATGTFSFGHAQESQLNVGHTAPDAPQGPDDTPSYFPPALKRPPVRFFVNFEVKLIEGSLPFSGADRGYVRIWARHRDPAMWGTLEGLIAIGDVLPPAAFPMMTRPGPNSSMNWIINLLSDHANTRDGWYMMETQLTAGNGGYSSQVMRVWNTDGDMVADGMQSVIIFA